MSVVLRLLSVMIISLTRGRVLYLNGLTSIPFRLVVKPLGQMLCLIQPRVHLLRCMNGGGFAPNKTPSDNTDVMRVGRPHDMPVALSKAQAKNKYVKHPGIVERTDKRPRKLYQQKRIKIIHELKLLMRHILGVLMPSDDKGGTRPYNISDATYDVRTGYLRQQEQTPVKPVVLAAALSPFKTAAPLEYIDTVSADYVDVHGVFTDEQRSVANGIRDVDADARIVIQFLNPEGQLIDEQVCTSEYDTAEPNTKCSFQATRTAPRSFKEAMQRPDRDERVKARICELNNLKDS